MNIIEKISTKLFMNSVFRCAIITYAVFGFGITIMIILSALGLEDLAYNFGRIVLYSSVFTLVFTFGSLILNKIKDIMTPVCKYPDDADIRFFTAKDKADKMSLKELIDMSEDINIGYDVPDKMFEIMLKIPIEDLEK